MRDKISENRLAVELHPQLRTEIPRLIDLAEEGLPSWIAIRTPEILRTIEQQNALYAHGRTKPGAIVTRATGGKSFHNYGLAIDFCILLDKDRNGSFETVSWDTVADMDDDGTTDWQEVVHIFEATGYEWGGKWRTITDNPHIQKTFGYTWRDLFSRYNKGLFIPGTHFVSIS